MSRPALHPTAAPGAPGSRVFPDALNVLEGYALAYDGEFPVVRFDADRWDFTTVPGRPAFIRPHTLIIAWADVQPARWRVVVKELLTAALYPQHPKVDVIPGRRRRPLPLSEVGKKMQHWCHWLAWLDAAGVQQLADVTQEHCDAYLAGERERMEATSLTGLVVGPLRDLDLYRRVLSDPYADGFRPWGRKTASTVTGARLPKGQNRTPWVPDEVFEPLLAGALFYVQAAAPDILAAGAELRTVNARALSQKAADLDRELPALLDRYRAAGRPLPATSERVQRQQPGQDPLEAVNVVWLGKQAGLTLSRSASTLYRRHRQMLEAALTELGTEAGGMNTPVSAIMRPDGSLGPWREPFEPWEIQHELRRLVCACFIVIAGLSGMRPSEVLELERGCVERLADEDGHVRYRLRSRVVKHRRHGGREETWTVIEPVAQAVAVMEQLVPAGDRQRLFVGAATATTPGGKADEKVIIDRLLDLFAAWQNAAGQHAGLPAIPDVAGTPWHLTPSQFRRTLARQLAFRPHGTIASKVHLKHVSSAITEGYFGPAGESAEMFLAEVEEAEREARLELMRDRFEQWEAGDPITGGASRKLAEDFAVIAEELEAFQGTVEQRDKRLKLLLRSRSDTLHVGLLNDCHFTDPRQARCLAKRGVSDADAPIISACEPAKCANALITAEHAPRWRQPLLRQIQDLLADRKVLPRERERLQAEQQRLERILEPFDPDLTPS